MDVEFKYASLKDLPTIVKTYNATIPSGKATADLKKVSVASKVPWFKSHNKTTRPLWILLVNGRYAGWLSFNSFYGRPAYSGTVEVSLYLDSRYRGKGLGKAALAFAIREAPQREVHTLLGFIFEHNTESVQLFRKHGFEDYGKLPAVANMRGTFRHLLILGRKV